MKSAVKSAMNGNQASLLEIKESLNMIKHMTHKQAYLVKLYREAYIQKFFLEKMNCERPGGIKYRKRRRGILAKRRMHVNSMKQPPKMFQVGQAAQSRVATLGASRLARERYAICVQY